MQELNTNGYILFKNVLNVKPAYLCFNKEKKIDYVNMSKYIRDEMLNKVDKLLGWKSDYIKFRVSDNNNSSDASTFHRDTIPQKNIIRPCFTCLAYLNPTIMEVIPKSHKQLYI